MFIRFNPITGKYDVLCTVCVGPDYEREIEWLDEFEFIQNAEKFIKENNSIKLPKFTRSTITNGR